MLDKQEQGRTAKRNGKTFEKKLDFVFSCWKTRGYANIEKTPEPYRYIRPYGGNGGMFIATFAKSAQPDYKGTLAGGRAIVLEAKSCASDRINKSMVLDTEIAELKTHAGLGALSGVIAESQRTGRVYFFPCSLFANMEDITGYKHIKFVQAEAFELPEELGRAETIRKIQSIAEKSASECKLLLQKK